MPNIPTLRLATQNLHWPNGPADYLHDIHASKDGADVICFQESYKVRLQAYLGDGWGVMQRSNNSDRGDGDNSMAWRKSRLHVLQSGYYQIGHMESGSHKTFKIAWILARVDNKWTVCIGSAHPPHGVYRREDPGIYEECAGNIAQFWRSRNNPVILGCDWNHSVHDNPGGLENRTNGRFVGGGARGIDGFLVESGIEYVGGHEINAGIRSDHPVVYGTFKVGSNAGGTPTPGGGSGDGSDTPQTVKTNIKFATSNLFIELAPAKLQEDIDWVTKNFDPDIWACQEAIKAKDKLRAVGGYGFVTSDAHTSGNVPSAQEHAILWKSNKWQLADSSTFKLATADQRTACMFMAHLVPKPDFEGPAVFAFSVHSHPHLERAGNPQRAGTNDAAKQYFEKFAAKVEEYAGKTGIVLWGGDLNVNRDVDDGKNDLYPQFHLKKHNLVDVWTELGKDNSPSTRGGRTIDYVGGSSDDGHIKATGARVSPDTVNSDHAFVLGTYQFTGQANAIPNDPGTPSEPGADDPVIPHSPFQKDKGHNEDIDHTLCCGGRLIP